MRTFKAAGVKCSICGDGSHPTRDCPLKQHTAPGEGVLDSEYDSLMAELSGGTRNPKTTVPAASNTSTAMASTSTSSEIASANLNESIVVPPPEVVAVKKQTVVHVAPLFIPSATPLPVKPPVMPTYGYQQPQPLQNYPQQGYAVPSASSIPGGYAPYAGGAQAAAYYNNYAYSSVPPPHGPAAAAAASWSSSPSVIAPSVIAPSVIPGYPSSLTSSSQQPYHSYIQPTAPVQPPPPPPPLN